MVKEYKVDIRNLAVSMLKGGMTQRRVSIALGTSLRTIGRWCTAHNEGKSLNNRPGRGRKCSVPKIAKIVISRSLNKKHRLLNCFIHPIGRMIEYGQDHVT